MRIWLDCDPGHDDAVAVLLALHASPDIELVGVSTVHGNAPATATFANACRLLHTFGAPGHIRAHAGAPQPLLRAVRSDPAIHGVDGLGGVEGLPAAAPERAGTQGAVDAMADALRAGRLTLVTTGPLTNAALFGAVHAELVPQLDGIVMMGGGVGVGNRSAVAEYNILCDPEAAQMVFDLPVRKVLIPLNVTHTALCTRPRLAQLLSGTPTGAGADPLPPPATPLRHTLSTLISFFAETYFSVFGFAAPPLHDALTIAYIARPELFVTRRFRVDVELSGAHTAGETVVDVWNYRQTDDSWGRAGKNCLVAESVDVDGFFQLFFECVDKCDKVSPLNITMSE